jgi:hypothetical protein
MRRYNCEYQGPRGHSRSHFQPALLGDDPSVSGSSPDGAFPYSLCPYSSSVKKNFETQSINSNLPSTLDATELELLSHYLTHTSQTIPLDDLDHYALSVGMPNIAFRSRPVMSSLIALAAACKCHDLIKTRKFLDRQTMMKVQELLMLAERHHLSSLQHIQVAVSYSDCYDSILANAALMVLYASASHSLRVYMATIAKRTGQELPNEMLPQHSQWMSFTRAAHTASTAILVGAVDNVTNSQRRTYSPISTSPTPAFPESISFSKGVFLPEDGPSERTKHLFLPLVASTYTQALAILREKVETTVVSFETLQAPSCSDISIDACSTAFSILETCASGALSTEKPIGRHNDSAFEPLSLERIPEVTSWVGEYMISVTSMASPKALRRTIMSFLNKAPTSFLNLVQSMLDSKLAEASSEDVMALDSPESSISSLDPTRLLAMDIFAHWLVLVMLLDGVWWIGGIGQWELGQAIALMKSQNLCRQATDRRETWWPESMHSVKLELTLNI